MQTIPPCSATDWKSLYRAAIFERDRTAIPQRVREAEDAIITRGREILYGDATPEEKESIEDALYALRAFRTALEHTAA